MEADLAGAWGEGECM